MLVLFSRTSSARAAGLGGAHDVDRPLERVVRGRLVAFRLFWLVGRTIDQFHAGLELVAGQLGGPRCGERARQHRRQDRAKTEHRGRSATTTNERRSRSHGLLLMCSAKETCPLPGWRRPHCGAADLGKSIKVVAAARKPVVWPDFMAGLVDDTNPTRRARELLGERLNNAPRFPRRVGVAPATHSGHRVCGKFGWRMTE